MLQLLHTRVYSSAMLQLRRTRVSGFGLAAHRNFLFIVTRKEVTRMLNQLRLTVGPVGIAGSGLIGISGAILVIIIIIMLSWTSAWQPCVF
jgi:hypothetical protein